MLTGHTNPPETSPPVREPGQVYASLRGKILNLSPGDIGIQPSPEAAQTWGVLMEMGFPGAVVTLVSLVDGTTSLYFSSGGGVIGGGEHTAVAGASKAFVEASVGYLQDTMPVEAYPVPQEGSVVFYLLTFTGTYMLQASEDELARGDHWLSPLFYRGQEVITKLRLLEQPAPK